MPRIPQYREWPEDLVPRTTRELVELYDRGYQGAFREPAMDEELDAGLEYKTFADAADAYHLAESGKGELSRPWMSVLHFDADAYRVAQQRGDCVSFGTRNAVDVSRAVEIHVKGESESWEALTAPEPIYWYRGHSGEGASCSRLAQWVSTAGGLLLRRDYTEQLGIDLTKYTAETRRWSANGRRGPDERTVRLASEHRVRQVTRVRTLEEARDSLANGYGINVCSSYGFAARRDEHGIARARGSWAHAMAWTGVDDRPETHRKHGGPLFLVQNSWGYGWISGPLVHGQPKGSFWITHRSASGMLRQGGAFAFSSVDGWPARKLPDYGATGVV